MVTSVKPAKRYLTDASAVGEKLVGILLLPESGSDDRIRVIDARGDEYTLRQIRNEVARCATELRRQGLGSGTRVLALLDHDPQAFFFFGAASAMGLRLMMPYGLDTAAVPEWLRLIAVTRPDYVLFQRRDRSIIDSLRDQSDNVVELPYPETPAPDAEIAIDHPDPIENFQVLFSSGTTGSPKAMSIAESHIVRKIASVTEALRFTEDAMIFQSGLMNNTTGVIFSFGAMLRGAPIVFPDDRDAGKWPALMEAYQATHAAVRPVALKAFVAAGEAASADLSCIRVISYGGGSVPRALLDAARRLVPGDWIQGYGLSETYGPFCYLREDAIRAGRHLEHVYCVGQPDETVEVRVVPVEGYPDDVGEVQVRGEVMEGYMDAATGKVTPTGEWFHTGDLGQWSPNGDLVLKGRMAGALLTENGHRIYPEEIEAVLADLPGASDVVLAGIADPNATDAIVDRPVVCLSGPIAEQDPSRVREIVVAELTARLSRERWPDLLHATVNPFPKSANGKIRRGELAKLIDWADLIELSRSADAARS
jgi:acyl-CoA synthetase (AMP-forming)/AMP-acid ligase II